VKPNNVKQANAKTSSKTPTSYDIDSDNKDQLIDWLKKQSQDPDYTFRGYKIQSIDTRTNTIIVVDKTGKPQKKILSTFLDIVAQYIKNEQGKIKIDTQTSSTQQIVELIKDDIRNNKTFRGKKIIDIDESANTVTIEGDDGNFKTYSIDEFIVLYQQYRKIGYGDSVQLKQDLAEQTRLQNIEDLTTAFRNALGIKPPKINTYAPLKITRHIDMLPNDFRQNDYTWTLEEISSVVKTGVIPNKNTKVDGGLNNYFNPSKPEQKIVRSSATPQAGIFESHNY
jgi:hypothetical protein